MKRTVIIIIAQIIYFGIILIFFLVTLQVSWNLDISFPAILTQIIGIGFSGLGLYLFIISLMQFKNSGGTPVLLYPPQKLLTKGPYKYCRHPMELGLWIFLLGLSLLFFNYVFLFLFLPLFVAFNIIKFRKYEEPKLLRRFGKKYEVYCMQVPFLIPRLLKNQK